MKKWFFVFFLAFAMSIPLCSAVAAEGDYIWWIDGGVCLSADGGESYVELPGLREWAEKAGADIWSSTGLIFLPDGGARVESRDHWAGEIQYTRTFSAREVADLLAKAKPNPVQVLGSNGAVTVGCRRISSFGLAEDGLYSFPEDGGLDWYIGRNCPKPMYSLDSGLTWKWGELPPEKEEYFDADRVFWRDGTFWAGYGSGRWDVNSYPPRLRSADGKVWETVDPTKEDVAGNRLYSADLGEYHFLEDEEGYIWVQKGDDLFTGARISDLGRLKENEDGTLGGGYSEGLWASYDPEGNILLGGKATSVVSSGRGSVTLSKVELETALAERSETFCTAKEEVSRNGISVALLTAGRGCELIRRAGEGGWQRAGDPRWSDRISILSTQGGAFLVRDGEAGSQRLYASEDGLVWTEVESLRPADWTGGVYEYIYYTLRWTGRGYVACRKAGESQHGMVGMSGGGWYEGNTVVFFLDEAFQVTGSHDFGRLVESVGYLDGAYYAKVANSTGTRDGWGEDSFSSGLGSTLYRSIDGETWTALPGEYLEMGDILHSPAGGDRKGNFPTGDPAKPLRTVAQLDGYRFVLKQKGWNGAYTVYLLKDGTVQTGIELGGMEEAIRSSWILPGEVTARYTAGGVVEVTVTDLSTPSMKCSITYPTNSLDWVKANLSGQYILECWDEQGREGIADVAAAARLNGEKEIVYRSTATGGEYVYPDSVLWSNSVELLPYSGKDFFVLDKMDGKVYRSANGAAWQEATGDFLALSQGYEKVEYCLLWTGKNYLACCYLDNGKMGQEQKVSRDVAKVFLLDEDLNILSSHDFGWGVKRLGFRDGVYYAEISQERWDERERYGMFHVDGKEPVNTLWRSTDGVNWEKTDIVQVRECLRDLRG